MNSNLRMSAINHMKSAPKSFLKEDVQGLATIAMGRHCSGLRIKFVNSVGQN